MRMRLVSDAIRELTGWTPPDDLARFLVDRNEFVGASRRSECPTERRGRIDAMGLGDFVDRAGHLLLLGVEHDHPAGAQVGDQEQVATRIDALIVEARALASERNIGDHFEKQTTTT